MVGDILVYIIIIIGIHLFFIYGIFYTIRSDKEDWNNGIDKCSGEQWIPFDTDSSGARGYKNGREYSEEVLTKALDQYKHMQTIVNNVYIGELDHPSKIYVPFVPINNINSNIFKSFDSKQNKMKDIDFDISPMKFKEIDYDS